MALSAPPGTKSRAAFGVGSLKNVRERWKGQRAKRGRYERRLQHGPPPLGSLFWRHRPRAKSPSGSNCSLVIERVSQRSSQPSSSGFEARLFFNEEVVLKERFCSEYGLNADWAPPPNSGEQRQLSRHATRFTRQSRQMPFPAAQWSSGMILL